MVSLAMVAAPLIYSAGSASADGGGSTGTWSSTNSTTIDLSNYDDFNNGYDAALNGISCFTGTSCVAAGSVANDSAEENFPMQLTGDAQTWGVGGGGLTNGDDQNGDNAVSDPNAGSSLSYLDLSGSDFSGGAINSISCLSTASTCVSVGEDGNGEPFLLLGDPTTWSTDEAYELTDGLPPDYSYSDEATLNSVSCVSNPESDLPKVDGDLSNGSGEWCEAVGFDYVTQQPIEISGDPTTWSTTPFTEIPGDNVDIYSSTSELNGVSCVSVGDCVAVGEIQVESRGSTLRSKTHLVTSLRQSAAEILTGIAPGDYLLSYNGDPTTWSTESPVLVPVTAGFTGLLEGVSCTSSTFCVAVGSEIDADLGVTSEPLFLTGDPTAWATNGYYTYIVGDSYIDGPGGGFDGVSCPTSTYCAAVGFEGNNEDEDEIPLVVSGDPSTWADDSATNADATPIIPQNVDNPWGYFNAVSCTAADTCAAVGYFTQYYSDDDYVAHAHHGDPGPFAAWINAAAHSTFPGPVLYPVTYLPNGASGTPPTQASLNPGATFTVAAPSSLTYPGDTFMGWSDGHQIYQPGATYTMPAAPVTLTAQWVTTPSSPSTPVTPASVTKLHLRTEVLFPFNKYYLTAQAKKQLNAFAKAIERSNETSFTVVGSTDLFGSEGYNIPLSEHRAQAVSGYLTEILTSLGVNDVVFHDTWIGISKTQPTYTKNRRTVVAD